MITIKKELLQTLSELNDLWLIEFQTIKKQLDKINDKDSALTIEAEFKGDKNGFRDFMKNMFRGSNMRDPTYQKLVDKYQDFIEIYKDFENAKNKVGSLKEAFEKYFFENFKELLTFKVENKFTIKISLVKFQIFFNRHFLSFPEIFVKNNGENL